MPSPLFPVHYVFDCTSRCNEPLREVKMLTAKEYRAALGLPPDAAISPADLRDEAWVRRAWEALGRPLTRAGPQKINAWLKENGGPKEGVASRTIDRILHGLRGHLPVRK
jgi:hypothetical protein